MANLSEPHRNDGRSRVVARSWLDLRRFWGLSRSFTLIGTRFPVSFLEQSRFSARSACCLDLYAAVHRAGHFSELIVSDRRTDACSNGSSADRCNSAHCRLGCRAIHNRTDFCRPYDRTNENESTIGDVTTGASARRRNGDLFSPDSAVDSRAGETVHLLPVLEWPGDPISTLSQTVRALPFCGACSSCAFRPCLVGGWSITAPYVSASPKSRQRFLRGQKRIHNRTF